MASGRPTTLTKSLGLQSARLSPTGRRRLTATWHAAADSMTTYYEHCTWFMFNRFQFLQSLTECLLIYKIVQANVVSRLCKFRCTEMLRYFREIAVLAVVACVLGAPCTFVCACLTITRCCCVCMYVCVCVCVCVAPSDSWSNDQRQVHVWEAVQIRRLCLHAALHGTVCESYIVATVRHIRWSVRLITPRYGPTFNTSID